MEEDMDANTTEMEEDNLGQDDSRAAALVPILGPEQLPDHCNLPANLPTRGKKEVIPNGSVNQQQKLQRLYEQQDKLLQEERVVKINRVAVGEWNHSKQLVEVKVEKGKFWQTMGYNANGKKYLYPEEGLFLLEMNIMELRHGKVPISVQQAYELMIPFQFSLEHYQVYSHLMRLGYITTRHKECDVSDYEYRINLDQFRHRQKQAFKKVQGWFQQMNETTDVTQQDVEISDGDSGRDIKSNKSSGSMSFHGSGVSGKAAIEPEIRSSSSDDKAQMLPGSGVSSDSSAENDDSSEYSDGPVEPKKHAVGSDVPSINLLEFHKKYVSDNSVISSTNKPKLSPTTMDKKQTEKTEAATDSTQKNSSRKRKLKKSSNQETSTDDQAERPPKKKVMTIEIIGNKTLRVDNTYDKQGILVEEKTENIKDVTLIVPCSPLKKISKTLSKDDSGKESESRRSSDGSIQDFPMKPKEAAISEDVAMDTTSYRSPTNDRYKASEGQDKSMKAKSSDLGTDLSSPSSIDVDIDDVLGILSPSSPRNDSMLEEAKTGCKYTPWNFQQIQLPNLGQKRRLQLPLPEYLPDSIARVVKEKELNKDGVEKKVKEEGKKEEIAAQVAQTDILQELVKVNQLLKTSTQLMESTSMMLNMENQEACNEQKATVPTIGTENIENVRRLFPEKVAARNWGEYKRLTTNVDQLKGLTNVIQSPVTHLWQGEVQPLVRPSDAVSTSYILHKLQIIQSANLTSEHVRWPYPSSASENSKIAFDVYQPDSGYKKSKPGQPGFQVVVSSVKDPVPDLATQAYLLRKAKPVKLLWSVVDTNADISFYSLQDVDLPSDITTGW